MKMALAVVLIFALLASLAVGLQAVEVAEANFIPYPRKPDNSLPVVLIQSPSNCSIDTNSVYANFTIIKPDSWFVGGIWGKIAWVYIYMDGSKTILFESSPNNEPDHSLASPKTQNYSILLTGLSQGIHIFQVNVGGVSYYNSVPEPDYHVIVSTNTVSTMATAQFKVDADAPTIMLLSLVNKTYHEGGGFFPLNFTVNEPTSWIGYSLDNKANTTLLGNITIEVQAGFHTLTVYANDTAGNMGTSNLVEFTLQPNLPRPTNSPSSPTQQPTPSSTPIQPDYYGGAVDNTPTLVMISITALTVTLGVVAYFYFKKRGR